VKTNAFSGKYIRQTFLVFGDVKARYSVGFIDVPLLRTTAVVDSFVNICLVPMFVIGG